MMEQVIHHSSKEETPPLLNPLILKGVLGHLDTHTLKVARSVCHLWNDVAAPIQSQRSYIKFNAACEKWCDLSRDYRRYTGHHREHEELMDMLNTSLNPGVILQNARMDFALLKDDKFLRLLEEYGHLLKGVVVVNCNRILHGFYGTPNGWLRGRDELQTRLLPFLTQYCTNLVHLKVEIGRYKNEEGETPPSVKKISEFLALESIEITWWDGQGKPTHPELKFLLEVLKASPNLKRFIFGAASGRGLVQSPEFCEGISTLESVKNFEEFGWKFTEYYPSESYSEGKQENIMETLEIISNMEMKQLRTLFLTDLTICNSKMSKLLKFFKSNGRNLRSLALKNMCIYFNGNIGNVQLLFSSLMFQEILGFCPALTSIYVEANRYIDDKKIDLGSLNLKPYPNLKKLVLEDYTFKDVETCKAIVEWFPNLVYLKLDYIQFLFSTPPDNLPAHDWQFRTLERLKVQVYIVDIVKTLQKLVKLQELVLIVKEFSTGCDIKPTIFLAKVIDAAHCPPALKRLTIINKAYERMNCVYTMDDLEAALMRTKSFDRVKLENFEMDAGDKFQIQKFIRENNLPVKFFKYGIDISMS